MTMRNGNGRIAAVLFDIDGTLITTGGAGGTAWRLAFTELYGIPADIGQFSDAGMTDPEVGRLTFTSVIGREPTGRELARLLAVRLEFLPEAVAGSDGYRVLAGVETLLPRLADAGYLLGLTTGGTESAARFKLARARLNRYFAFGGYGSDSPDRTELTRRGLERAAALYGNALTPDRCFVVGDTPLDIAAAKGAGAVSVAVASGHFTVAELADAGADHVLASLEEELPL
jgi:phosphoglycolate phosphatase-like HAD superfamily hydrolase